MREARVQRALQPREQRVLVSQPTEGECPVNFDGQEQIYTFGTASGPVQLASCEVEIDPAHPLFVAVENAFASLVAP